MKLLMAGLILAASAAAQTPDQTGSITGVVTDAVSKLPVKKTLISAQPNGNFNGPRLAAQSATTDAAGTFTLNNLPAGKYRLTFQHSDYPQSRFGGQSKMVEVKAGESTASVTVELMPGASVTGRVLDEDGDPLLNCNIQLHPAEHPEQGTAMTGSSPSNQNGEYRAFGIAPGKYILSAHCGSTVFQSRPFSAGPDPPPAKAYPTLYYPLTTDPKSADLVDLVAGTEKSGIDFQMTPTAVTQVRGAFSPSGADWHGNNLGLLLTTADHHGDNLGPFIDQAQGTFQFRQVFPGSYILVAFSNGAESRVGAWQRVEVSDKPVDLTLELRRAFDLSGKVEIESSGTQNALTPAQIQIGLNPESQFGPGPQPAQVGDDGTFTLKGVLPGLWNVQAYAPGAFLKSAWLGSTDVTNVPLDLSSGAAGALKIIISTNTATIRGSAPAGQMVYARSGGASTGSQADQSGQYVIRGLAPGKYRFVLADSAETWSRNGGQEVTVREGETVMIDLKTEPQ
ncbi:MAG: carboxypeptidase regulatory-like domain-containing protein [Bryobacteraceae bacterium]